MNQFEQDLLKQYPQVKIFSGSDEAGRGCLAGPLVAATVVLPSDYFNPAIKDSKKLTTYQREQLFVEITKVALDYAIYTVSVEQVEEMNPKQASIFGMEQTIQMLKIKPDLNLTDAEKLSSYFNYQNIIDGDNLSQSIGAASILAKVTRDLMMVDYHKRYPVYNFKNNKGYGTKEHLMALQKYGLCPLHRKTYAPVKKLLKK
ncbi:ribonuclease HII [Spiroplasma eriocheiris]|uniref:Ribonuclease HII n=1 Tax=Spiroplasma eriocheiris TaxID=315358 RepID=A0A0H3XN56_9MOLU|nr:ribonuclease HII [Spiroplasma eriocheiris]AHF58155.1 putative ribonuclease HII [Spiroplasma eriocheiris CCTCC M 207170]AKM54592.1 ribonuclease HII [Spiroplasma eriocheiris]